MNPYKSLPLNVFGILIETAGLPNFELILS